MGFAHVEVLVCTCTEEIYIGIEFVLLRYVCFHMLVLDCHIFPHW